MGQRPTALFVTYGGGHVGMVLPVINELERMCPDVNCVLLALTTGYARAKAQRPTLGYKDFLHLVDQTAALEWGNRLLPGNTSPDVPEDETRAYLGINYLDLVEQFGEEGAANTYQEQGRYGFRPQNFMRKLLESVEPQVVVATNSPRSEEAVLTQAKALGIPTVGMVDLFGLDSDTYVMREVKPDRTCVISDLVRERLVARGFPAQGVVVTGNPAFDGLFTRENRDKAQQFVAQRGWQGLTPILWAGHVEPYAHPSTPVPAGQALPLEIEDTLREYVRTNPQLALTVRYHPSDWHSYPRRPEQERVHFSEPPREPIHPLILASRVVVVQTSTVGLESAVAGKTVVSVENSPAAHIWFSLAGMEVSTPCATPAGLPKVLTRVLDPDWTGSPKKYTSDGVAAVRVAQVVAQSLPALLISENTA
jgi:hypothetical protein